MIKVVTDSTSYIPSEWRAKYDIKIVSLNITHNEQSSREIDIDLPTFYTNLVTDPLIPMSSQPSPDEIYKTFEELIISGHDILGIFLSSEMSGTYASSQLVKQMLLEKYPHARIELLDSRTNCMQLGFISLTAAQAAEAGHSMEEVIEMTKHTITNSRFLFCPESLRYLKKGGRIGGAAALLGGLLKITPILTVVDGKTEVFTKVRTKKKAISTMIEALQNDLQGRQLGGLAVHHINCPEEGTQLAHTLEEHLKIPVIVQSIGPVIGVHVGPGSIGIAYYTLPN